MKVVVNNTGDIIKVSSSASGVPGPAGPTGNGIESVTLINTVGLVNTYQILFTDGTTFNYDVTDGQDATGPVSGDNTEKAISTATPKTTLADADTIPLTDSEVSSVLKKITWLNIKTVLTTFLNTLYASITHTHTASQVTDFDTEVSNNVDVASNTAKKTYPLIDENKLSGIEAGAQVNTVSPADIVDFETSTELNLRDTANRSRTNHTGTQTASTISDFDTEVSNNVDVTANTAKVSNATHTGDVTGSGALSIESAIERESNTVLFDNIRGYVIGNAASRTGNILFDFTGAKLGSSTMMIHQDASPFTLPAESVVLSGTASDTVTNYIYFLLVNTASGSEKVHVTISQEVV